MEIPRKAIALLSAGLDSTAALQMALRDNYELVLALTFDYGQRSAISEVRQATLLSRHFQIPHRVLSLPWFTQFTRGGTLLKGGELPSPSLIELDEPTFAKQSAQAVWVPNRNGVFLEIAAGLAEDCGASTVLVGFNAEEGATFPDNSIKYLKALNKALRYSTSTRVQVQSPTAPFRKSEIIKIVKAHHFPFELLWSCYESASVQCGKCESCMRLKRALHANRALKEEWFADPSLH